MKLKAYIHSLKDKANDRHVLGEAEIIKSIGDNQYLATQGLNPWEPRQAVLYPKILTI